MTREHDALRDLIAPVALGSADPREIDRVEAHAAECAVCREELISFRASADVLAVAIPQHAPAPRLKESLMSVVRAEAAAREAAAAPVAAARPARRRPAWLPSFGLRPAVALVAAVAALAIGWGISAQLSDDPGRDVTALAVQGTADAPGVTGKVVYVPGEDTAVVTLERLPALAEGDAYQLWVLRDGSAPRSAGLFRATGPGMAERVASNLEGADGIAVTAQPRTSRTTPELPILVQAPLTDA